MPMHIVTFRRWQVVLAFAFVTLAFTGSVALEQINNNQRIRDIQRSRVVSCRVTYEGVRQVFKPFFLPPKKRTPKMRQDIRKFNRRVDALKANCGRQTATKGAP